MLIRELFESDVTRDIPPVVYFHEDRPEHLKAEVEGYIITGGYPEGHPRARYCKTGIHEQYVRLLRQIRVELEKGSSRNRVGDFGQDRGIFRFPAACR